MQDQNLFFRNDTMLGVCEAIGQDFGFHANWLRIAFCGAFFFSPMFVVGAYLALGLVVAVVRLVLPASAGREGAPVAPVAPAAPEVPQAPQAPAAPVSDDQMPLAA